MKKLFDINSYDTRQSVSMMLNTVDTLNFIVPQPIFKEYKHSLLGVYEILNDLMSCADHLKQQYMSDFIGDALRPFTAWDCDLFEEGELESLEGVIKDEITDYMQYVQTYNASFYDMDVRVASYDVNTEKSDECFSYYWDDWKKQPNITITDCKLFVENQVRIVYRYNVSKKRIVNGFSCSSSGKFQYDNLERNVDRAVFTPVHEKSHNSQRCKEIKNLSKDLLVEQVLMLSPVKRNPTLALAYGEKIRRACELSNANPSVFTVNRPSSPSVFQSSAPMKGRKSLYVSDWLSQNVGPTRPVNPPTINLDKSDMLGSLQPVDYGGHTFSPKRREALAEGGVLHAYLFLHGALPKVPNPFCYDPDEVNERMENLEG